jgi:hypothetical protein
MFSGDVTGFLTSYIFLFPLMLIPCGLYTVGTEKRREKVVVLRELQ